MAQVQSGLELLHAPAVLVYACAAAQRAKGQGESEGVVINKYTLALK